MTLWLVRCGDGAIEEEVVAQGIVGIGWGALGDLTGLPDRDAVKARYMATHDESGHKLQTNLAQVYGFYARIQIGDLVALPLKHTPAIAFGRVTGGYHYVPDAHPFITHQRTVEWINTEVPRSSIDQDLLYSLGAFLTVCKIERHDAEARILAVLNGTPIPAPAGHEETEVSDIGGSVPFEVDLAQHAKDQIRAHIEERFQSHALSSLVEAVLQAQGYTTKLSPPGPDGGVDVLAGSGRNGFDNPRLAVQVKSGKQVMDAPSIRDLIGTMQNFRATHGLFVSWSGFNAGAQKLARDVFFTVRLWDSDELIEQIFEHYDKLPDEVRADIPLRRIWTLMPPEE